MEICFDWFNICDLHKMLHQIKPIKILNSYHMYINSNRKNNMRNAINP